MKENDVDYEKYQEHYDEESFWEKIKKFAAKAGAKVIYAALKLYYATKSEDTPKWAKSVIVGALGYFILPIDLIPDVLPGIGFTDDLGVLLAAIATVTAYITPEIEDKAKKQLTQWFGEKALSKIED